MITTQIAVDDIPYAVRKDIANGCGPKNALIDFVPDTPLGAEFRPPCENHDLSYHIGENDEDKTISDLLFLVAMVLHIIYSDASDQKKFLQLRIAMDYYMAVHFKGRDAFYADK